MLTNESEKTSFIISCTILPKKKEIPYMERTRKLHVTKNLNFVDSLVMETLAWTLYILTRKYSDCMQDYTMLLEQCEHIVVKDLATAT